VGEALPVLLAAGGDADPAVVFWGAAVRMALHLIARGRLLPGVSPGGYDAWRIGPLDAEDGARVRDLAAAMPPYARAVPLPAAGGDVRLPDAYGLVRAFMDAVADTLPRTPAAALGAGGDAFAATEPVPVGGLRDWADDLAAGVDTGVRISLRVEIPEDDVAAAAFRAVVQVHSLADPALVTDAATLWTDGSAAAERADTLRAVRRAARVWAPLESLLASAVPAELVLGDDEIGDLLGDAAARLAAAGIDVHWPRHLAHGLTAAAVLGEPDPPPGRPRVRDSDLRALLGGDELLGFDWRLALGDEPLTDAEMDALAEAHRPVVRLRDRWVLVAPDVAGKARSRELKPLPPAEALRAALTGHADIEGRQVEVRVRGRLDALRRRLADPERPDPRPAGPYERPAGLNADLRDYQTVAVRWLTRMTALGLGACLADDMGLGKTVTLIAVHLHRQAGPAAGPTLVVCPASLLGNWEREIHRFAPGTPVRRFHGGLRDLGDVTGDHPGFVLTTYGTMRRDTATLAAAPWRMIIADEAQHVKNPRSATARALRDVDAGRDVARVALTGTPVENNLTELWAILDWTTPGLLGALPRFRVEYGRPIEDDRDDAAAARLARLVRPFLLRRRKSDPGIAPELPPKTETDRPVTLTREQAALYEATVRETMALIAASSGMARRGLVLRLLTALKQICNHPAQYLKEADGPLDGRSGKLELLDELLDTIIAADGAVLVFTQFVAMARLIERHLAARGVPAQLLHGGTPVHRREEMVRRFEAGEVPVFLLSLKAAGTGLNLTRAGDVVHVDRWWNPAVEEQATDRAYRIGQTRPVQVHRLIAEGTVEDRIAEMLRTKRELADAVLDGRDDSMETALTELSDAELSALVELRSAP
jgi:superfamily II DNA or RNA helicase